MPGLKAISRYGCGFSVHAIVCVASRTGISWHLIALSRMRSSLAPSPWICSGAVANFCTNTCVGRPPPRFFLLKQLDVYGGVVLQWTSYD
ncbi:hypothetical protein MSG28_008395 [Choristoneura fumiferana]|uniref:Uncharacterized protein n=1 Tax=Choristoneura fumiferana TaxID=7141 RepID=A0ACC0J6Z6_CHOFU|nr:hypothetical protein MSG28_008395 [Choristoneura fumiferana]